MFHKQNAGPGISRIFSSYQDQMLSNQDFQWLKDPNTVVLKIFREWKLKCFFPGAP